MEDKRKIQTDVLLNLRKQVSQLRKEMVEQAKEPEFEEIKGITSGTIFGVEMALKMIDANIAVVTGDQASMRAFLDGEDDAFGDGTEGYDE